MNDVLDTQPELAFDEALYKPLPGDAPMGRQPEDWQISLLEADFPPEDADLADGDATPRNYHDRREMALELLEKGRDLRLYVRLAEAQGRLEGPKGLHAGLHLLASVTRSSWAEIHPGPPEDSRARNLRLRAFGPFRDRAVISAFDPVVLFDAGGFDGKITLRNCYVATERHKANKGRRPPKEGEPTFTVDSLKELVGKAEARDAVAATRAALGAAAALLKDLQAFLTEMPEYQRLNFAGAIDELNHYMAALAPLAGEAAPAPAAGDTEGSDGPRPTDSAEAADEPAAGDVLNSHEEAQALLDQVIAYYATSARSSPIPLVLLKIRDMNSATFTEWLMAVAPGGPDHAALAIDIADPSRLDAFLPPSAEGEAPAGPAAAMEALDGALAALKENDAAVAAASDEVARLTAAVDDVYNALKSAPVVPARNATAIKDRAEVREALKRLAHFWRNADPSSPASLCFERLIHLVDRPFMDIVRELAPEGNQATLRLAPKEAQR